MEPEQCRAGRALLALKQIDLAKLSGVSLRTIIRFEKGGSASTPANLTAITKSLKAVGVEFIDANGGGPGVRLRKG